MTPAQIEQRRTAGKKGGAVRAAQFTRASQQAARAHVKPASNRANGAKGAQATLQKHGGKFMAEKLAAYRREHPSALEQTVMRWLDDCGHAYSRDVLIGDWYYDFVIGQLVVEADGAYIHRLPGRPERDAVKEQAARSAGYQFLRLSEQAIRDESGRAELYRSIRYSNTPAEII